MIKTLLGKFFNRKPLEPRRQCKSRWHMTSDGQIKVCPAGPIQQVFNMMPGDTLSISSGGNDIMVLQNMDARCVRIGWVR